MMGERGSLLTAAGQRWLCTIFPTWDRHANVLNVPILGLGYFLSMKNTLILSFIVISMKPAILVPEITGTVWTVIQKEQAEKIKHFEAVR